MIDSDYFFHQISLAEGYIRNQNYVEHIHKTIDIYDTLLSYDIDFNKTFVNTILSKLIDLFKNCDNQTRFMINNILFKYQAKFNEIFIKGEIVNSIIQVLTCNDSTSRFYAIQLTKYLPFLFENRMDLIYNLIDLLINKSSSNEKREIIELIQNKNKKFNYNKIFLKEIVENFEEIYDNFLNDQNLKFKFLKLIDTSLKVFSFNQVSLFFKKCTQIYHTLLNILNKAIGIESNLLITILALILYKISSIHNFLDRFMVNRLLKQNEIIENIFLKDQNFHTFLSFLYFVDINQNTFEELLSKYNYLTEECINLIKSKTISKYSLLGFIVIIFIQAKNNHSNVDQLLLFASENISFEIESKYFIRLIYTLNLRESNMIFKILNAFNIKKSSLFRKVEVYQLNQIINSSFQRENYIRFLEEVVDIKGTCSSFLIILIKSLKLDFIKNNEDIEKIILEKKDSILMLHYYYIGGHSNYDRIKLLYESTNNLVLLYKLLKITMCYKDFKNFSCYTEYFINRLKDSIDAPSFEFYKEYFSLLSQSLSSTSKVTNFFTRKVNLEALNENFTSNFFKLKLLKYNQICVTYIDDFFKLFISAPYIIVRTLYKILSYVTQSKIDVLSTIDSIDCLLNSCSIFLLNKERIIKNLISIKLNLLKFKADETALDENNKMKISNEVQSLISRVIKYYSVFHEPVTFKFEIKYDLQKEAILKKKENFNVYLLVSLKGLGYYNINSIQIHINLKSFNETILKNKIIEIELKENEKIILSKAFIFKLMRIEEGKEMKVELEINYIFKESLKFKFVSVVKKLNN